MGKEIPLLSFRKYLIYAYIYTLYISKIFQLQYNVHGNKIPEQTVFSETVILTEQLKPVLLLFVKY